MKGLRTVKVLAVGLLLVASNLITPVQSYIVSAVTPPALIFSEIKVRNDTLGFNEYVEIYNPGATNVSLNDYYIEYLNSSLPTIEQQFTQAVIADGLLEAGKSLILAQTETDPNLPNSRKLAFSSLSDSNGTLRIVNNKDEVVDQFSWTSTLAMAIAPVQYLSSATSTKIQSFNRNKDLDGNYILVEPTWLLTTPSPQSSELLPLPEPEPEQSPDITPPVYTTPDNPNNEEANSAELPADTTPSADEPNSALPPVITELLPNPAPPATDADDEFIEIYNPNNQAIDLSGYKLQSGSSFSYSYTFEDVLLEPLAYKAFSIKQTGNILSNTKGQARLLDENGVVVAQTNVYESADEGDAWALINGVWQWTITPTPGAPNILELPVLKLAAVKSPSVKKSSNKSVAKKPAKKVAAAKTTKPKTAKAASERSVYNDPESTDIAPVHPGILAGVGTATLVYGMYEYKQDFFNRLRQFRRYRSIRRAAGSEIKG